MSRGHFIAPAYFLKGQHQVCMNACAGSPVCHLNIFKAHNRIFYSSTRGLFTNKKAAIQRGGAVLFRSGESCKSYCSSSQRERDSVAAETRFFVGTSTCRHDDMQRTAGTENLSPASLQIKVRFSCFLIRSAFAFYLGTHACRHDKEHMIQDQFYVKQSAFHQWVRDYQSLKCDVKINAASCVSEYATRATEAH